jgi:hypothetical protein
MQIKTMRYQARSSAQVVEHLPSKGLEALGSTPNTTKKKKKKKKKYTTNLL